MIFFLQGYYHPRRNVLHTWYVTLRLRLAPCHVPRARLPRWSKLVNCDYDFLFSGIISLKKNVLQTRWCHVKVTTGSLPRNQNKADRVKQACKLWLWFLFYRDYIIQEEMCCKLGNATLRLRLAPCHVSETRLPEWSKLVNHEYDFFPLQGWYHPRGMCCKLGMLR